MVNLKFEDEIGHLVELKSKSVFAAVIDPEGSDADAQAILLAQGNAVDAMVESAGCIGSTILELTDDPVDQHIIALAVVNRIYDTIKGKHGEHKVQQKEFKNMEGE